MAQRLKGGGAHRDSEENCLRCQSWSCGESSWVYPTANEASLRSKSDGRGDTLSGDCGWCGHGGQERKCAPLGSCPGPCRKQRGPGYRMDTETSFHHRVGWVCIPSCLGCEHISHPYLPPNKSVWRNSLKSPSMGLQKYVFTCKLLHSTLVT